jgi:hypothetical protein
MRWDDLWTVMAIFGVICLLFFLGVNWSTC